MPLPKGQPAKLTEIAANHPKLASTRLRAKPYNQQSPALDNNGAAPHCTSLLHEEPAAAKVSPLIKAAGKQRDLARHLQYNTRFPAAA